MRVWIAGVSHRHGVDLFVAATEDGLYAKLAGYARDWWHEAGLPEEDKDGEDRAVVEGYFGNMMSESLVGPTEEEV